MGSSVQGSFWFSKATESSEDRRFGLEEPLLLPWKAVCYEGSVRSYQCRCLESPFSCGFVFS